MDNQTLLDKFEAARKQNAKCNTTSGGGVRDEKVYGAAYQELVKAGLRPQIKAKYRPTS